MACAAPDIENAAGPWEQRQHFGQQLLFKAVGASSRPRVPPLVSGSNGAVFERVDSHGGRPTFFRRLNPSITGFSSGCTASTFVTGAVLVALATAARCRGASFSAALPAVA
jgi:hypothetical protein